MNISIYMEYDLGDPKFTAMRLLMADPTAKMPIGILHDMLVIVESFMYSADFVILDHKFDLEVRIILGRIFLATMCALVDLEKRQMKFRLKNEEASFNICRSIKKSGELQTVSVVSYKVESISEVQIEERLEVYALMAVIINLESDRSEEYGSSVAALERNEYKPKPKKFILP